MLVLIWLFKPDAAVDIVYAMYNLVCLDQVLRPSPSLQRLHLELSKPLLIGLALQARHLSHHPLLHALEQLDVTTLPWCPGLDSKFLVRADIMNKNLWQHGPVSVDKRPQHLRQDALGGPGCLLALHPRFQAVTY